jgi:PAS domain S-box-containing protein
VSAPGPGDIAGLGLEEVIRYLPTAVVVVEVGSGRIVHCNARALEMTERQLGRPMPSGLTDDWEIFHADGRPYLTEEWPLVRSMASGENVVDEEYFNVLPDGSRLVVCCSSSPVYDDKGGIVAGVLVMDDVTERKHAEERLGFLAGLLDHTDDAIVALDAQWYVTVWNKGAERMYGWTADEVLGRHTLEVAQLDISYEDRADIRREVAERGRWRGEVVACRKDGTPVRVELITVALRGEPGEITGYLGIHRDVTGRRQAEEALREAQDRSETILESITDAFVAVDRDWRYTYVNERALRRMEWRSGRALTRGEVLGQDMWETFPDALGTEVSEKYHAAMREQRPVEFEAYFAPSGEWVEAHAYPSESGLSIYYRDVSERRRAEQERESRARQQALVAELGSRALAADDLQPLLDEAVGLVAGTLDVELAGVGEIVRGSDEIVFRAGYGWGEGRVGGRVDQVGRDSLMGYTLRAGEPVIVEDMVTDGRFTTGAIARDHGVVSALSVMIETPDEPFGTLGALSTRRRTFSPSEVSFVQAVANILGSAVERSRGHERLIEVREVERRRIARDLHDDALQDLTHALALAGRAPEQPDEMTAALKRVGEQLRGAIYDLRLGGEDNTPFADLLEDLVSVHRAMAVDSDIELDVHDGVPAGPLGGTGIEVLRVLGEALTNARRHARGARVRVRVSAANGRLLAEVSDDGRGFDAANPSTPIEGNGTKGMRERAQLLHGRLDISSDPATGTTVRLDVPLHRDDERAARRVRVLLVEDHTAVREAIAAAFERDAGFEIAGEAASLAEARGMLEDVDVAVLDLGLPDGFGADLIPEIRAVNPHARALVLSGTLDHATIARAIERGAAGALDKVAHLDEVVDAVRRLQAGEAILPLDEVVELLRFASDERERRHDEHQTIAQLTPRELEVLQALADGLDSRQVADRLHISIRTERHHVTNVLTKLGVHSQLQALVFAVRHHVVEIR